MQDELISFLQETYDIQLKRVKNEHLSIINENVRLLSESNRDFVDNMRKEINEIHNKLGIWFKNINNSFQLVIDSYTTMNELISNKPNLNFDNLTMTYHDLQTIGSIEKLVTIIKETTTSINYTDRRNTKLKVIKKLMLSLLNVEVKGNIPEKMIDIYCFGNRIETLVTRQSYNLSLSELSAANSKYKDTIRSLVITLDNIYSKMSDNLSAMMKNANVYQNNLEFEINKNMYVAIVDISTILIQLYINRLNECILMMSRIYKNQSVLNESTQSTFNEIDYIDQLGF